MKAEALFAAVPIDRLHALAAGAALPEHAEGAALFADVAGFTALAGRLAATLGPRRGAEELTGLLNRVYGALVERVHLYGGSIVGFSGDAINCWFDAARPGEPEAGPPALARALTCGLRLQEAMGSLGDAATAAGPAELGLKVAVSAGRARRLLLGDPQVQLLEVLAGPAVSRLAGAAPWAARGEVVLDPATARLARPWLTLGEERGDRPVAAVVVAALAAPVEPWPWPEPAVGSLRAEQLRPWMHPGVEARLSAHGAALVAGLRPAVALMLRFDLDDLEQPGAVGRLDALVRRAQAVAAAHGGTLIDVTMGDHGNFLYVAFGAPEAHDDDPARAVACALALSALEPPHDERLRIGLAAGTVRVGLYGGPARRSYGVIGEPPTLACRLMDAAPPGAIWCDGAVARQAGRSWAFAALPPIAVKGRAAPVPVFQPAGARPPAQAATAALLGRERELAALRAACAAIAGGQGQTLIISGEAGIGKTRLAQALHTLLAERGVRALQGAGASIAGGSPYHAWRPIFAALLGLGPGQSRADRTAAAAERAAGLAPGHRDRLPLLNELLDLALPASALTSGLDPQLRRENLELLLMALLRAAAATEPLAIVIEDGHWLDSLSWTLAQSLAQRIGADGLPVLLALTSRPLDEAHLAMPALRAMLGLPTTQRLALQSLPPEQCADLVAARLEVERAALPEALVRLVEERSGGNPFFVEELVADLRERGLLGVATAPGGAGPRVDLAGGAAELGAALPGSLEALLLARIDRLAPDEQLTLKLAAVVGPTFTVPPLAHLRERHAPMAGTKLRNQLRALAARDLTALEAPEPRLAYSFRHVLTHSAAYGSLLYAQRRQLHLALAEWHEAADGGPTDYPLLAHHYRQAEERERERHYTRLAGIGAADRYANAEAIACFTRALELTAADELETRFELLLARERLLMIVADHSAQRANLDELERVAAQLDDPARRAAARLRRGMFADVTGAREAEGLIEQAVALARAAGDRQLEAEGLQLLGRMGNKGFQLPLGHERLREALAASRAAGAALVEAETLRQLGVNATLRQSYAEALGDFEQALERFRACGDRPGEARALLNIGIVHTERGDKAACRASYEASLAVAQAIGDVHHEVLVLGNMGNLLLAEGRLSAAIRCYERAEGFYRQLGDEWGVAWVSSNLGNIYSIVGAYERADAHYTESLQLMRSHNDRQGELWTLYAQANLLLELGRPAEAAALVAPLAQAARELASPLVEAMMLTMHGRALLACGRYAQAEAACRAGLERFREVGEHACAEPLSFLARIAWQQGEAATALAYVEACLPMLLERPLIEQENLFPIIEACWQSLQAAGDPRADPLLERARAAVRTYADGLDEPELRRSLLTRVRAVRTLLEAAPSPG